MRNSKRHPTDQQPCTSIHPQNNKTSTCSSHQNPTFYAGRLERTPQRRTCGQQQQQLMDISKTGSRSPNQQGDRHPSTAKAPFMWGPYNNSCNGDDDDDNDVASQVSQHQKHIRVHRNDDVQVDSVGELLCFLFTYHFIWVFWRSFKLEFWTWNNSVRTVFKSFVYLSSSTI